MSAVFPNPPVDVTSLMAPMSADIVNTTIINSCVTLGIRADLWPKEGALRSAMFAVATVISGFINDRIAATQAGWLPTSAGAWLTWLAFYMYGVLRTSATFASGAVTLTNNGGGVFSFQPFTWTCQNPTTGMNYQNTSTITLGAGPGTTDVVNIQATVQGSAGNSSPGQITTIVTTMPKVTCTNVAPVLGIDAQSDPSLQLECWNAIAANSAYGPRQSFGYAVQNALNSVTSSPVNINRWLISLSSHQGQVTVTVASPQGIADPNDVTGVATNINAIARPECVTVTTQGAAPLTISDALTVYVTATPGLSSAAVQTAMGAALSTLYANYPIGGRAANGVNALFAAAVEGALYGAWPGVFEVTLSSGQPVPDHAMISGPLPQVAVNNCTIAIVLV
jgi:Baseplate J-like protein